MDLKNHVILCQTDTASVLSEAIEYIKFLHEQVSVSPICALLHFNNGFSNYIMIAILIDRN